MFFEETFSPNPNDINRLTQGINDASKALGVDEEAYPFAFFLKDENGDILAGCNGSVIYGSIYTDQLWVDPAHRHKGYGHSLMEKVHTLGIARGCTFATAMTMDFQGARNFYERLGYVCDFERPGYVNGSICVFLKKRLSSPPIPHSVVG